MDYESSDPEYESNKLDTDIDESDEDIKMVKP